MYTDVPVSVVIYSSNWCGFCAMAKRLLVSKGAAYEERVVDGDPALRAEMVERAGRTSVPQIFINQQHVGGCDDLHALDRSGQLEQLLTRDAASTP